MTTATWHTITEALDANDVDYSVTGSNTVTIPMVARIHIYSDDNELNVCVLQPNGAERYRVALTNAPLDVIGHTITGIAISLIGEAA